MMTFEEIQTETKVIYDMGVYEIEYIEENEYCAGGYGVATIDGYYLAIAKCSKIK